jgi:hypothetical protein
MTCPLPKDQRLRRVDPLSSQATLVSAEFGEESFSLPIAQAS